MKSTFSDVNWAKIIKYTVKILLILFVLAYVLFHYCKQNVVIDNTDDNTNQNIIRIIKEKEASIRRLENSIEAIESGAIEREVDMEPGVLEKSRKNIQELLDAEKLALEEFKKWNGVEK